VTMDSTTEPSFSDESMRVIWSKDPFDHVKKDGSCEVVDVLVRTLDKKEFKCRVSKDITVHDLKIAVSRATGVQSQCQRLLSAGKEMADDLRLSDYSQAIKPVVYLVVRFPGASFGATLSEKEDDLPSTVGEESALRSYAFRGTVTIPVPERSIERVMASLLQRGVVNGGQLQQLAALSANSWRSALNHEEPLRRSGRSEASSHSHSRRPRRRDQRGAERERERESLRRREPVLSRHRSPQTLEQSDIHDRLLEPRLYDDARDSDYLLPAESANLDDNGEMLSYAEGYDPVTSMPELEALVLQPSGEIEEGDYYDTGPANASSALQASDWDTIPEEADFSLPEGRMTGKRKHSRLSSSGDFAQESVSSTVRRHRCDQLDPSLPPVAEPPLLSPGSLSHLSIAAPDVSISEAGGLESSIDGDPGAGAVRVGEGGGAQVPIVMSLAAGPRQFASVPEGLREGDADARDGPAAEGLAAPGSGGRAAADAGAHAADLLLSSGFGRTASTPSRTASADLAAAAADGGKGAAAEAAEAGAAVGKETAAEEKLLLSMDSGGRAAAVAVRAHDCVLLAGERA
jgi:hypothetical protein